METIARLNRALGDRYRIDREIGAGGMATVYVAEDLKHGRRVAVKVLKPELAAVLGVERFLAEIRVTANLQHPNLLPLFDSGDVDGMLYYVMPLVQGESLRARLERERQLPVDDAVRIGSAIANAVDYAHGHGVIHRDLKPENILIHAGEPVVTDFGIALAVSLAGGSRVTQTGLSLGTPQYMSPEQATGDRAIDARTDIYSLGAVVYEMLAGEPPHIGGTVQAIIARVVTERPQSLRVVRPSVPEHVALAVEKALEKVPADRWSTAREFADALQGRIAIPAPRTATAEPAHLRRRLRDPVTLGLAAAALLGVGTAAALAIRGGRGSSESAPVQFAFTPTGNAELIPVTLAVSPEGQTIAFSGRGALAERQLFVRRLDELEPRAVEGTEGVMNAAFSPDGQWIAFSSITRRKLYRVSIRGGPPLEIADIARVGRLNWCRDGRLVFTSAGVLSAVPARGGAVVAISRPDTAAKERYQENAVVLDDGETVVYASMPSDAAVDAPLAVTTTHGGRTVRLDVKGMAALGTVAGRLLYVRRDGAIMAVPFDASRRRTTGDPVAVGSGVTVNGFGVLAALAPGGTLVTARIRRESQLVRVDGGGVERVIVPEQREFALPRASPDGRHIAVNATARTGSTTRTSFYWTIDVESGTMAQLSGDSTAYYGEWTPDGRGFVYLRTSDSSLVRLPADGSGDAMRLTNDKKFHYFALHPDNQHLVYSSFDADLENGRLMVRALAGDTTSHLLEGFPGGEWAYRFSPDGHWLAYHTANPEEVYVRPYPGPGPRVQVSQNGGAEPVWSRDGKRLYYRDLSGRIIYAADIKTTPSFEVVSRKKVAEGNYGFEWDVADYDAMPNGDLLLRRSVEAQGQLVIATNWPSGVRERLAASMR